MERERRTVSLGSLESLFRDLHVAVTLLHAEPDNTALIGRYVDTIDLIWDTVTGEPSLAYSRPRVFCKPITRKEVKHARGT